MSWQSHVGSTASEVLRDVVDEARETGRRFRDALKNHNGRVLQLIRPNLEPAPPPVRRLLEPVVAVAALSILSIFVAIGGLSLVTFMLAGAVIYAIVTRVFGLELEVNIPEMGDA